MCVCCSTAPNCSLWQAAPLVAAVALGGPATRACCQPAAARAAAACPSDSRWVVVTNGDNDYDPGFLEELVKHEAADMVAFDYYSRFQNPTGGAPPWPGTTPGSLYPPGRPPTG